MICKELIEICTACRDRYVNVVERSGEVVVYADLMKELFDTMLRRVVEAHVSKCANEIAAALVLKAERYGWREVDGKMRFFYVVR
jgi:flagellin-specific chaperone FliS